MSESSAHIEQGSRAILHAELANKETKKEEAMPETHNDWKITRVLNWYHCAKEERQSVWIHCSEIPFYTTTQWTDAFGMKWWLNQRLR